MGRILAVANQKGGVAKTTTVVNLGAALALAGYRTLLVDMDPQANLTSGVGLKGRIPPGANIYAGLTGDPTPDPMRLVISATVENLFLIAADRNLTGAEVELVALPGRELRLWHVLTPLRSKFDYVLIDTPPSLGLLTLNALVAADAVLIPTHCEYFALEGLADLLATLRRVRAALNPNLAIDGVVLTMYDDRTNLAQQVARDIRAYFGDRVFDTVIPRNVRLGEAPSHGLPVMVYDPRSRGAESYGALAREFLAREGKQPAEAPVAADGGTSRTDG
jgi:chromosome partitioning protein